MTIYSPIQHIWRPCSFWAQQSAFSTPWSNFDQALVKLWPGPGQTLKTQKFGLCTYANPRNHLRSTLQLSTTNIWAFWPTSKFDQGLVKVWPGPGHSLRDASKSRKWPSIRWWCFRKKIEKTSILNWGSWVTFGHFFWSRAHLQTNLSYPKLFGVRSPCLRCPTSRTCTAI